jgi:hypothetical protein
MTRLLSPRADRSGAIFDCFQAPRVGWSTLAHHEGPITSSEVSEVYKGSMEQVILGADRVEA